MNVAETLNAIYQFAKHQPRSISSIADEVNINHRYAREVVGLMTQQGLLAEDEDTMEYIADPDVTALQVQAVIDLLQKQTSEPATVATPTKGKKVTSKKSTSAPRAKKVKNPTGKCLCGCGENSTSNYRPGHDARHASAIGKEIAANFETKGFDRRELLAALPSDALKAKAEAMAERINAKKESK